MSSPDDPDRTGAGFSVVILAGGTATRMGGIDKAAAEIGGRSLLDRAIDACLDADEIVVVGDHKITQRPVTFVREDPAYGGPVAGLLTGVDALLRRPTQLGVLAVDMPHVTTATFRRLRESAAGRDAAFLFDTSSGRRQLAGVLDAARLGDVRPGREERHGMAVHRLLGRLEVLDVAAIDKEARDVDTWADLRDLAD